MRMKASEVGDWLRQIAGKRDHRELVPEDDYVVLRPGRNFDWLMGNPAAGQPTPSAPEQDPVGEGSRVAQLDRASAFEAEGCRFEPCRGHHQCTARRG